MQRSASSWLHFHLSNHPEIFMPKRKELHYFSSSTIYPSQSRLSVPRFSQRILASPRIRRELLFQIKDYYRNLLTNANILDFAQSVKFELAHYTDEWYLSQLNSGDDRLSGEITPAYSFLQPQDIDWILKLLPNVKIILILRDPIDRSISHLRHTIDLGFTKPDARSIDKFLSFRGLMLRNDYPRIVKNWKSKIDNDRLFLGYYDNLQANREKFLGDILRFLGVDTGYAAKQRETLSKRHNGAQIKTSLPDDLELRLARQQLPMLEKLYSDLGSQEVKSWLERAETILKSKR